MLFQIIDDVAYALLMHPLMKTDPNFVVNWVYVGAVGRRSGNLKFNSGVAQLMQIFNGGQVDLECMSQCKQHGVTRNETESNKTHGIHYSNKRGILDPLCENYLQIIHRFSNVSNSLASHEFCGSDDGTVSEHY